MELKHKLTIGIDVDLTLLDPVFQAGGWFDYLESHTKRPYLSEELLKSEYKGVLPYNFSILYPDLPASEVFYFWKLHDLYQRLQPYKDAVEVVQRLSTKFNIFFISHCKADHFSSKAKWLKDTFQLPNDEFYFSASKEKEMFSHSLDIMIDDRLDNLNRFVGNVDLLCYNTCYEQHEAAERRIKVVSSWKEIENYIKEVYL